MSNIIALNDRIEAFVQKNDLSNDAYALKKEHAIQNSEEWQKVLDSFAEEGRVLRVGIIGRVKAGKSSLLNALLFDGRDILPKAATPMTAALTIMEYSDSVSAEVDFFTQQDIDEIKKRHDAYLTLFQAKLKEKEEEAFERLKKKKAKESGGLSSMIGNALNLFTPAEQQECQEKARKTAEREMKDDPTFAAYDQYCRIQKSGKSLRDLETYRTIEAASVEELMNGALNQFVGSTGAFMPFTKSVTLRIPEHGLQGLQIIDTPGINDPVTSRGERTEQLLQECDVVLLVSPSGQFLSGEDTELMYRVTTKEGTQQAYIIASQVDNQLYGSEKQGLDNPIDVVARIANNLTTHARNVLRKQATQAPEMQVAFDKLSQNNVICSSSVAFAMQQRFDAQHTWDENTKHVWSNLQYHFPNTFSQPESAKNALSHLANMDKLHAIIDEITANKEQILADRRVHFENTKRQALQSYLKAWDSRISERVHHIETMDVGELRQQEQAIHNRKWAIENSVGDVYDDLVHDIKLNLDKQLKDKLAEEMRKYDAASEGAQGTETKTGERTRRKWIFFKTTETYTYEVFAVQTKPIRNAIEDIRSSLEDNLRYLAENYSRDWKKKIYSQVVGTLREAMGDDELDKNMIARAVKNVLARIPESSFQLNDDMPSSLKKSGKLTGSEAEEFVSNAENYVSNLKNTIRNEITSYMNQLVSSLKGVNLAQELTGDLESNLKELLHDIENKEASLFRYQNIANELKTLQQEATH